VYAAALAHGARVPVCLVAADGRIARRRHPLPTGQPIDARVMVVVCVERGGLICSVTRLVSFAPVGDDLRRRHDAVCRVDAAAARATRVGRPLREIFAEIVATYEQVGFPDEWRHHHQGGSTGYQPRDTIATPAAGALVQRHQLFAWNPSIAGTKTEDTMLATPDGFRWITSPGAEWPSVELEVDGRIVRRPDILLRT
jgi:antitoxin VapB